MTMYAEMKGKGEFIGNTSAKLETIQYNVDLGYIDL
jgi:hypothetical protein